ncbi:mitochondrial Homoaconitase [Coemansia sp. IMI 203386]|nr:mitochondrial Homoaconitase [Coemansia sp. IMI 203386]
MSFRLLVAAAAARRVASARAASASAPFSSSASASARRLGSAPALGAAPQNGAQARCPTLRQRRGFAISAPRQGGQTLVEKIAQRHAVGLGDGESVRSGDFIAIRPRHIMTHDNTGAVIPKFKGIGATRLADAQQPVFALDHDIQNKGDKNMAKYHSIEQFAATHGNRFYPAGRGIAHQVLVEEGHAWPGTMVVGSDSHSNMYGGIGCLGTPVVRTDAAAIWATAQTWWQAPPVARVELRGALPPGVVGKDVIVALCALFGNDEVLNHAVEFAGDGVRALAVEDRLAIANMTTEWGALAGLFAVDETVLRWYEARAAKHPTQAINDASVADLRRSIDADPALWTADADAAYAKRLWLDLSTLTPHVSGPDTVKAATPLATLEPRRVAIHKAYVVSCVNSRAKDLREAADVVRAVQRAHPDKKVAAADGVAWYVAPASSQVLADAQASGDWQVLLDAGARPLPPGCGPCIGLGVGLLEDGEVGISATNRNYKGRMGSKRAHTYLASPAVVAASALRGYICSPAAAIKGDAAESADAEPLAVSYGIESSGSSASAAPASSAASAAIDGFPAALSGRLVFLPADNLNTDGIYPGKYTYQDDITRDQMRAIVMENYDPEFSRLVQPEDVVVAGANFGTGSSREQAATALLAAGVRLVICESASETFKRNAVNNGLLVLESPTLVSWLRARFDSGLTIVTGLDARVALTAGKVALVDSTGAQVFETAIPRIGKAAQEIIVAGGLENWVRQRMAAAAN